MSSSLLRQDLVPMVVGYVLIMGALAIGLRIARRSARAEAVPAPAGAPVAGPAVEPVAGADRASQEARRERSRPMARARSRAIVRSVPGWGRLAIHCLGTAVGGYLLLMVVIIGYYYGIAPVSGNFVQSAFSGCALLVGLAAPVFAALSWLAARRGWRI